MPLYVHIRRWQCWGRRETNLRGREKSTPKSFAQRISGEQGVNFTNNLQAAFLYLHCRFKLFWRNEIGAKAARKMLVKLTLVRHRNRTTESKISALLGEELRSSQSQTTVT